MNQDQIAALKAAAVKEVEGPSGSRYRIRRLSPAELIQIYSGIPDLVAFQEEARQAAVPANLSAKRRAELADRSQEILRLGLLEPRIGDGPDDLKLWEIPGGDMEALAGAIITHSDFSEEAARKLRPTLAGAL